MKRKYIFFDVDGTLIDRNRHMPPNTRDALQKLSQQGHAIFIATGRSRGEIPPNVTDIAFEGYVCGNGAYTEYQGNILNHHLIPKEALMKLAQTLTAGRAHIYFANHNRSYVLRDSLSFYQYWIRSITDDEDSWREFTDAIVVLDDLFELTQYDVEKIIYFDFHGDYQKMKQEFANQFLILPSSIDFEQDTSAGEVTAAGVTKAYGIEHMIQHLNIDIKDVITFGDGYNDLEMTAFASIGVAMGNAVPALKEIDDLTVENLAEDGISKGLIELGLIEVDE